MSQPRLESLLAKLTKGHERTYAVFSGLSPDEWQTPLYESPHWSAHQLLAHFVSAEEHLLELSQDVAEGGPGAPVGFDIDAFNTREQERNQGRTPQNLMLALERARQKTIAWVQTLTDEQLDRKGRHPALGIIRLEEMLIAIYGHQILHMRDLARLNRAKTGDNPYDSSKK